jgi:hypothetical protein
VTVIARVRKAIGGAVAAGVAAYAAALDGGVSPEEWGTVAGAVVGGFLVVYFTPKNAEA